MEHTKELLSLDLSTLVPLPYNVRRHMAGQVEELAALIDSQGLLHNLVVTEQVSGRGRARKLKFAAAADERRRRALMLLRQRSRLPKGREATHPADEFAAFKALSTRARVSRTWLRASGCPC